MFVKWKGRGEGVKVKIGNDKSVEVGQLSLDQWRRFMGEYLGSNPTSGSAWDILTCLRGPDSPCERVGMSPTEASIAYDGRRKRKFDTVEVIRSAAFFGIVGGVARHHPGEEVLLPPEQEWDHFDKHVWKAARRLGLKVVTK